MPDHVPPGRAGRLWLLDRLAVARRSKDLLDRKRQLLRRERDRLASLRDETRRQWVTSCAEAERWGLRATVIGGVSDVGLSAGTVAGRATADVVWRNTMGVRHPAEIRCMLPELPSAEAAASNAAVGPAAASYRQALEAAVAHAAADASWRLLDTELRATDRRLRAIERYRLPVLAGALRTLELRLDELEREERVVGRWARRRRRQLLDTVVGVDHGGGPATAHGPGSR
jgi:V/A-type H+-transporting ATPase subunit D